MDNSEDLSPDDNMMVYRMTPTSILSSESAAARGAAGTAELGRRLLLAARHGDTQLVLDLMAKGAPFTTDWLGTSALHLACLGAHVGTCGVLLRAGVSRDARTKVERTPLHYAAHAGHAAVAALLLHHRAQPDTRDMLQMTPLHWAAQRGHGAVVALLLRHGADPLARSKFNKTPRELAAQRSHAHVLQLIDAALTDRQAAHSLDSLHRPSNEPESTDPQPAVDPVERLQEAAKQTIKQSETQFPPEPIKISIEKPSESSSAGVGNGGCGAAAAMLRRHGIALLPRDEGSTVLSALQSGRSVVLSDAGKLMLKESSEVSPGAGGGAPASAGPRPPAPPGPTKGVLLTNSPGSGPTKRVVLTNPPGSGSSKGVVLTNPPGSGPTKGVVLTATPVKSTPRQGVKIFTLNNKLLAMPKENKAPVKKVINPHDSMQVQYIKLSSDAKIGSRVISMKAKNKVPGGARPVKLTLHNTNFNKLLINDNNVQTTCPSLEPAGPAGAERNVLLLPEEFLTNSSAKYLRTQLLSAHRTIAQLNAQLNDYKTRLANYENV